LLFNFIFFLILENIFFFPGFIYRFYNPNHRAYLNMNDILLVRNIFACLKIHSQFEMEFLQKTMPQIWQKFLFKADDSLNNRPYFAKQYFISKILKILDYLVTYNYFSKRELNLLSYGSYLGHKKNHIN